MGISLRGNTGRCFGARREGRRGGGVRGVGLGGGGLMAGRCGGVGLGKHGREAGSLLKGGLEHEGGVDDVGVHYAGEAVAGGEC